MTSLNRLPSVMKEKKGRVLEETKNTDSHIGKTRPNSTVTSVVHAARNTAPALVITGRDTSVDVQVHVCKVGVKQCPVGLEPGNQRGDFGRAQVLHTVIPRCLESFLPLNPPLSVGFDKICSIVHARMITMTKESRECRNKPKK